jgi:hypothetical protein
MLFRSRVSLLFEGDKPMEIIYVSTSIVVMLPGAGFCDAACRLIEMRLP